MSDEISVFHEVFYNGYENEPEETKELTPEMLREFSFAYEKKFSDGTLSKDRIACFEIMKRLLEEEKNNISSIMMNKFPQYFEDVKQDWSNCWVSENARRYDEVKEISMDTVGFHGSYRCGRCSGGCSKDEDYCLDVPTDFFLDPDGPEKRKEFFKNRKQIEKEKKLKAQQEAIAKQEQIDRETLARLQNKYKNNP